MRVQSKFPNLAPRVAAILTSAVHAGCSGNEGSETRASSLDKTLAPMAGPIDKARLRPVERVPRSQYGVVGNAPLGATDVDAFIFPGADAEERSSLLAGLKFFSTEHTAAEGLGPANNQSRCLGCHLSAAEAVGPGLIVTSSQIARAARATPTNFAFTALDPATGGGRAADVLDAATGPGRTAAFTIFGDFSPATGTFDDLHGLGGPVQHTRPSTAACLPDAIPPLTMDPNLASGVDPVTRLGSTGLRRTVGERAGPPYIGRGLIEAIYDGDLLAQEDRDDARAAPSSLDGGARFFPECPGDCISGRHNENTSNQAFEGGEHTVRVGRFGLRAAGPTILQFVQGGVRVELGFTSSLGLTEQPASFVNQGRPGCAEPHPEPEIADPEVFSCRQLIRMTAPPEFGADLLTVLRAPEPSAPLDAATHAGQVQRGAVLFGVDLDAFANRMIAGRMPASGDGKDDHALNTLDHAVGCADCHTPVQTTGASPAQVGGRHLSNVWAPIFSDILLHEMPEVTPERIASTPRNPVQVMRGGAATYDLARNLADDTLPNQGVATGREFRTPPLMALGRVGPPFLHDARVYLSALTVDSHPAGTVHTDATTTNAPLVVRTVDDALKAAIELHDLPPPDDARTPMDGGCPVPPGGAVGEVHESAADLCPPYDSPASKANRSEARLVMRRWRSLSAADQQAVIEFLNEL
jgi:CxxC motif-containing protein (DUF1111 family)